MNRRIEKIRNNFDSILRDKKLLRAPIAGDALTAKICEKIGFKVINIPGIAVNTVYGQPDRGFADFYTLFIQAKQIIDNVNIPVVCDVGTGHGFAENIKRTVHSYETVGAAGICLDDGVWPKRCGEMSQMMIAPVEEMNSRIKAAVDIRKDNKFKIFAHSAARNLFDLDKTMERYRNYLHAGVDGIYVDGINSITELRKVGKEFKDTLLIVNANNLKRKIEWQELCKMGYSIAIFDNEIIYKRLNSEIDVLKKEHLSQVLDRKAEQSVELKDLGEIVDLDDSIELENRYIKHE